MQPRTTWILDETRFLSEADQHALRSTARHLRRAGRRHTWTDWLVVELGLETGLRIGELSTLRFGDLVVEVSRPGVHVRRGKGGKARYVRVRRQVAETLRRYRGWKAQVGDPTDPDAPVFLSRITGRHMTVRALQKAFRRVCDVAGVTHHHPHDMRHTFASELLRASKNLRLVQKQLGHSRITTTQVYADVFDDDMDTAMEQLYRRSRAHASRRKSAP